MYSSPDHSPRSAGSPWWSAAIVWMGSAVLLGALVAAVSAHPGPFALDADLHRWVLGHRPEWARQVAVAVTTTGSGVPAYALAALAGALARRTSAWRGALAGLIALASAQLVRITLARALARPRPSAEDWATEASGWAMPSGHTTTSMVVAVLLTLAVHRRVRGRGRPLLLGLPVLWAVAVGLSRVYLGVHWPTDVAAGWLLAAFWAASAALLVLLWRRRPATRAVYVSSEERQRP
ncbi:phosphatase PAP2 family protein [Streptomyces sp. NPDC057137]|uniref:phosphatase PAP2 family protein n=1 Tax=Streptomyces sp. NPDC057137 TaxID=3346030 RepID=UPI00362D89A2